MPLFEVAIILEEVKDREVVVASEQLALPPKCILAKTSEAAAFKAVREVGDVDLDRMRVLVRPFA